ncbi:hypothetical protein L873DRAFT_914205 [Choiromyces venosus 120613-1]|uniref:Uncharacterized protein n=1 Tax=Choiromyces venosus 120613-1 TaxID=1336337 RepID=A0A3N4ISB6_9PEZI|nr:hypothetical protein L873DRAFT_914205 [Choiromyces venosus 120613-1]
MKLLQPRIVILKILKSNMFKKYNKIRKMRNWRKKIWLLGSNYVLPKLILVLLKIYGHQLGVDLLYTRLNLLHFNPYYFHLLLKRFWILLLLLIR